MWSQEVAAPLSSGISLVPTAVSDPPCKSAEAKEISPATRTRLPPRGGEPSPPIELSP